MTSILVEFENDDATVDRQIDASGKTDEPLGGLIAMLDEIQSRHGYLPEKELRELSSRTGRSLVDIYGVATFFRAFSLNPRGKHVAHVCLGTACHVRNAPRILGEFETELGVKAGETTSDGEYTLETVNCLGACALGPTVVVDGKCHSNVTTFKVRGIIESHRNGDAHVDAAHDERLFPVEVSCSRCNHSLMDKNHFIDERPSIHLTVARGSQHGVLRLSSIYGSYSVESDFDIPPDTVSYIFCPHCHTELIGGMNCPECGVRMVPMLIRGGGTVQICPRRGCKGHILDLG